MAITVVTWGGGAMMVTMTFLCGLYCFLDGSGCACREVGYVLREMNVKYFLYQRDITPRNVHKTVFFSIINARASLWKY